MVNKSGFFGRCPDSYNLEGDPDNWTVSEKSDSTGRPGINIASNAISFWIGQQDRDPTVGEIADAFKMPPAAVVEACEANTWLFVCRDDDGPMENWVVFQDGE